MNQAVIGLLAAAAVSVLGLRASTWLVPRRTGPAAPVRRRRGRRTRDRRPSETDVARWCDDLAREVRSGSTLAAAVRECDSHDGVAGVIGPLAARLRRGQPLGAALRSVDAGAADALGLAVRVLRSCADLGGPAASPLERVAATLRERDAIRQEQQSQSAQARMSARVMTLVPIGMLALLTITDAKVRGALATPPGIAAVVAGAALNLTGWFWMQRIIGRPR